MQEIDFYLVDAFSASSFGGNPAAVCPLDAWLPDETLLRMAQQHNQSETAFLCVPKGIELRWFTTLTEVNLCGHATLAAAYVLFNELDYPDSRLHFDTASGRLTVSREGDWMTLDFPACPTQAQTPPPEMLTARYQPLRRGAKGRARVLVLESREQVEALNPDFSAMTPGEHKVAVTARDEGNTTLSAVSSRRAWPCRKILSPAPRTPCCSRTGVNGLAKHRCLPAVFLPVVATYAANSRATACGWAGRRRCI